MAPPTQPTHRLAVWDRHGMRAGLPCLMSLSRPGQSRCPGSQCRAARFVFCFGGLPQLGSGVQQGSCYFSASSQTRQLRHWELLPGTAPPEGRPYSLSKPEREAMEKCINNSLAAGLIRPSSSPAGAGFFFVEKNDKTLRLCID